MKFDFCGGFDCPDWLLSEIATLSKISSVRVKLLSNEIVKQLNGYKIDYNKIKRLTDDIKDFTNSDVKAILSALNYIILNSVRNNVDGNILSKELQQIGLPRESANAIKRCYIKNNIKLTESLKYQILSLNKIKNINWSIDFIKSSSIINNVNDSLIRLNIETNSNQNVNINMTKNKLNSLLHGINI